jgi:hypothetical protein
LPDACRLASDFAYKRPRRKRLFPTDNREIDRPIREIGSRLQQVWLTFGNV